MNCEGAERNATERKVNDKGSNHQGKAKTRSYMKNDGVSTMLLAPSAKSGAQACTTMCQRGCEHTLTNMRSKPLTKSLAREFRKHFIGKKTNAPATPGHCAESTNILT